MLGRLQRVVCQAAGPLSRTPLRPLLTMADVSKPVLPGSKEEPKSFARRDRLRDIEKDVQARWAAAKVFEADAPADGSDNVARPKYMATFPYPYMNGRLHLGHAFTVTKADFAAGYQRLRGKNVLFPFAFHCTGMPIQAAASKLKREIETGSYLKKREEAAAYAAAQAAAAAEAEAGDAAAPAPGSEPKAEDKPAAGSAKAPDGKFSGKKTKAVAKGGGPGMSQYDILLRSGIPEADVPAFAVPEHWLGFFPPLGKRDLTSFGCHIDWRRSFITTDVNPYYDAFIRWQFNTLRKRGKLGFGKRPTIFSPTDGQACMDHERASGEGVGPQEYTLIKLALKAVPADHHAAGGALKPLADALAAGKRVFFVAATLRPETMYGQTNCFLLPEGDYGAFLVSPDGADVFVCTERSARNMAYQGLRASEKEGEVTPLPGAGVLRGEDLLGLPLAGPYASLETVYSLPLLTISMKKGTGVVTSVPSDAPDDFAALRDLKDKPKLREKYRIADHMVLPFDPIPIIDIPGFGTQAAVKVCEDLKIRSQNDKALLAEAKDRVYLAGFYSGVMLTGKYAGRKVADAKPLVRADMMAEGLAAAYWEPENEVISRSGDECVVAQLDQWYLTYGEEEWRGAISAWVHSPHFTAFSDKTLTAFDTTIGWLKEWACSRSFGLGTKLPWDPQFVIESLSDSTIYMAYYTVAHLLQGGNIDPATGAAPGPSGIRPDQLSDGVWDYIFFDDGAAPFPAEAGIPAATLEALRREFRYWYPMDLRVSGKDLIGNHLTMSLYNHAAIWSASTLERAAAGLTAADVAAAAAAAPTPAAAAKLVGAGPGAVRSDRMPRGFFCNGHVLVDGEKMAKQKGNFLTLEEAIGRWGADATRLALADAGDGLEDANFERDSADNAILRLTCEEEYARETLAAEAAGALRPASSERNFADKVFDARISAAVQAAEAGYEGMRFRDALAAGCFVLQRDRDTYRDMCGKLGVPGHAGVLRRYLEVGAVLLAPITPHFSEFMWGELLGHGECSVTAAPWPSVAGKVDPLIIKQDEYMQARLHAFRVSITKALVGKPKGGKTAAPAASAPKPTDVNIYVASRFTPLQQAVIAILAPLFDPATYGAAAAAAAAAAAPASAAAAGGAGAPAAGGAGAAAAAAPAAATGFPPDVLARVKAGILADPAHKASIKAAMEFASVTVAEHRERAEPSPTLRGEVPFDEAALWLGNLEYVAKALDIPAVHVLRVEEAGALESDPTGRAKNVVPLEPFAHAFVKE